MKELILIGGLVLCGLIVVVTYVFPSSATYSSSTSTSSSTSDFDGSSLIVLAVIALAGYFFYYEVYPKFKPATLLVTTALKQEGTNLAITVQNTHERPYLLRQLKCSPIGSFDDPTSTRTLQVDKTIGPGQKLELSTAIEPSIALFNCKQTVFE